MVIQYNHIGKAYKAGDSVQDAIGNWSQSSLELVLETRCRAEPARANQYITGADGKQISFSSIVYMPKPATDPVVGMLFEVWDGERLMVREPIKQYSPGQLNARVWL